jgi:tetratricopeptide (TPR) repeat protein
MHRYEEALDAFAECIKADSKNVEYLFNRSQCLIDASQTTDAASDLAKALQIVPQDAKLMYHLGLVRYAETAFEVACNDFVAAAQRAPYAAFVHDCLYHAGLCCARTKRHLEAVGHFNRAIEKQPECAKYVHERAKALQVLRRLEESYRDFSRVLELQPGNAFAYFRRAFVLKQLGKFDAAAEDFEQARRLAPTEQRLVVNYRKLYDVEWVELVPPGEEPEWGNEDDGEDWDVPSRGASRAGSRADDAIARAQRNQSEQYLRQRGHDPNQSVHPTDVTS